MKRVIKALDARVTPLTLFFRDDDAGWSMDALDVMLGRFAEANCPVDLAVIPAVLSEETARHLSDWRTQHAWIGLHQHGYAHINYEPPGARKCEFGSARPIERQCADIMIGRERLRNMLGESDAIFTPPWNRCSRETVSRLGAIGFRGFSADHVVEHAGDYLAMIPIAFDWDRMRREARLETALADMLAMAEDRAGIMLHHATLEADDLDQLADFIGLVATHPALHIQPMRHFLESGQ
jgi:predicted deacetylase